MCRMGFVSQKVPEYEVFEYVKNASIYYSAHNSDGFGTIFIDDSSKDNQPYISKSVMNAFDYWTLNGKIFKKYKANSLIYHCRLKASGELNDESSHPFVDDGHNIAIAHNGVIYGYEDMKKELISKGYTFKTEVDSEVLLYTYIEYGDDFIKKLDEFKVGGSINLLIFHFDGTINVYSYNGTYKYVVLKDKIIGASDSDVLDALVEEYKDIQTVEKGHIVSFKDGKIIDDKDIGVFTPKVYNTTWNGYVWSSDGYQTSFKPSKMAYKPVYYGNKVEELDIDEKIDDKNNLYSSEYSKNTYSNNEDDISNSFIDELGYIYDNKEDYYSNGVFFTKTDKLIEFGTSNFINIEKRGLKELSDYQLYDISDGEVYASYEEYKKRKRNERKDSVKHNKGIGDRRKSVCYNKRKVDKKEVGK